MSAAPMRSGRAPVRFDSRTRTADPGTVLCTTMRMVWSVKLFPLEVMAAAQPSTQARAAAL